MTDKYDKYKTVLPYPRKANFVSYYVYKQGECVAEKESQTHILKNLGLTGAFAKLKSSFQSFMSDNGYTVEKFVDEESYHTKLNAYRDDENRLHAQYKADLFEEHDVTDNPKKDLLYSKAYDLGHSAGYSEVASYFGDLVELIE